jgi:hypothetical protein
MSLEGLKQIFEIGGVILLFLTFIFGAGALYTASRLNVEKDAQLRQFDKDLTDNKGKVAGLEQDVANAKAEMARQQTRAAEAERSLLELQEKIRPRHLSREQKEAIKNALKGFPPHRVEILTVIGTPDGDPFGRELADAINSGGWQAVFLGEEATGGEIRGLGLVMKDTTHQPPGTKQLQDALKAAGLPAPAWNNPHWGGSASVISLLVAPKEM